MTLHTIALVASLPETLFLVTFLVSGIGILCAAVACWGAIMRGWSGERTLTWLLPTVIAQMMERHGYWPLIIGVAVPLALFLADRWRNRRPRGSDTTLCGLKG